MTEEEAKSPTPSLPTYITTKHFIDKKQQGPLNKILSRMLKPKMRRAPRGPARKQKKGHAVHFY